MANVQIEPANSRRLRKQFLELPWRLHRHDPNWIPPLRLNQKELVNYKKHPFYDQAEIQTFVALRDGEPVGRIAALVNHAHNAKYNEQRGFFGFFESIDDRAVAHALFDAAKAWLVERGMTSVRGPANPSQNYEVGLLVEGFDSPPTFMMTYNPEYYVDLVESYGFQKSQDLLTFWGHISMLYELDEKLAFVVNEAKERFEVTLRPMDRSRFKQELLAYLDIYNRSLDGSWGFVPLSDGEIKHLGASLKQLIVPELTCLAVVDGKPIGAVFALLDYNPRIKRIDGKLFPFGWLKLLTRRREIKTMRAIATTVVPEYQKWGIGLVVLSGLVPNVIDWGIEECEFSWVLESNRLSRKTLEKGGAKRTKMHRVYDLDFY